MDKELLSRNTVLRMSVELSLLVIEYCDLLQLERRFIISNQLLKAGTSIGANIMEAQNSESKADFIHKMKIAAKESEETQYWILLCSLAEQYPDCRAIKDKLDHVQRLLAKIIKTAKRKNPISYLMSCLFL